MAIFNKYKNNLNDLIDSSDIKFPDKPRLINKALGNISRSKSKLIKTKSELKKDLLDKIFLDKLL